MATKKTDLVKAEQERARTAALFRSIGDGIIATDENGVITDINSSALRMLGYNKSELLGKWFPTAIQALDIDGQNIDLMERPASQAILYGKPITANVFYRTKPGKLLPVAVNVAPIMVSNYPEGVIEVFRDISHEHEVDKMKSEFISIASHQLRTPLTAIKTYAHLLSGGFSGKLNKKQTLFLEIILGSIERMNDLINTLLDISRIEEGMLAIARQFVNLEQLTEEVVAELRPAVKAKKQKLTIDYQTDDLNATTDPVLVREVCSNLVSNAVKYTPEGGKIDITIAANQQSFVFSVTDSGYGIPKAEHSRVFTKFYRGGNIVDKDTGGTGLGLYLVKQIADQLDGKVTFKSKEGEGSCFVFRLPR